MVYKILNAKYTSKNIVLSDRIFTFSTEQTVLFALCRRPHRSISDRIPESETTRALIAEAPDEMQALNAGRHSALHRKGSMRRCEHLHLTEGRLPLQPVPQCCRHPGGPICTQVVLHTSCSAHKLFCTRADAKPLHGACNAA